MSTDAGGTGNVGGGTGGTVNTADMDQLAQTMNRINREVMASNIKFEEATALVKVAKNKSGQM